MKTQTLQNEKVYQKVAQNCPEKHFEQLARLGFLMQISFSSFLHEKISYELYLHQNHRLYLLRLRTKIDYLKGCLND